MALEKKVSNPYETPKILNNVSIQEKNKTNQKFTNLADILVSTIGAVNLIGLSTYSIFYGEHIHKDYFTNVIHNSELFYGEKVLFPFVATCLLGRLVDYLNDRS
jgi:hypothetical protein